MGGKVTCVPSEPVVESGVYVGGAAVLSAWPRQESASTPDKTTAPSAAIARINNLPKKLNTRPAIIVDRRLEQEATQPVPRFGARTPNQSGRDFFLRCLKVTTFNRTATSAHEV